MIRRILDPNPQTRINMAQIKEDKWFNQDYTPVEPEEDEEDIDSDCESFSIREVDEFLKLKLITTHHFVSKGNNLNVWSRFLKQTNMEMHAIISMLLS